MTEIFVYESYCIALCHILFLFLIVFINTIIYMKTIKGPLLFSFFTLQGILALWITAKILKTFAPNASVKFVFVVCQYAGICFLGTVFIVFAHIFARGTIPSKKIIATLLILSSLCFLTVATNPLHHLFYASFDFWGDSFGPLFYLQQVFSYLQLLYGSILCGKKFFDGFFEKRIQAVLLICAIAIPVAANLIYVFGFFKKIFGFSPPFDITPMSTSISLILFAFAAFKLKLFENLKIARKAALSNIPEGILLIHDGKIAGFNKTFADMADCGSFSDAEKSILNVFEGNVFLYKKILTSFDICKNQDFIYKTKTNRWIRVICRPVFVRQFRGAFIRFVDITEKQNILKNLESKKDELQSANRQLALQADMKKKLAIAKARNFMAQEAHDILGNSIMLVISLLEIARLSEADRQKTEYVKRAKKILDSALEEISMIASAENPQCYENQRFEERLEKLADEFRTAFIAVEIHCFVLMQNSGSFIEDTLFKLCREGITNALRHGNATRIDIILRSKNDFIELFIIDNGTGCKNIQKGMGLSGMEHRILSLKGVFHCHSLDDQGFCVQASIPFH